MNKTYIIFAVVVVVLAGALVFTQAPRVGGVASAETYYATTTTSADASAATSWLACKGSCVLGSVTVTQPGTAGWVRLWNATSTATSSYTSDVASSTRDITIGAQVGQILGTSDVAGTYMFDARLERGLVIETSTGFDGQYVVTWKQ